MAVAGWQCATLASDLAAVYHLQRLPYGSLLLAQPLAAPPRAQAGIAATVCAQIWTFLRDLSNASCHPDESLPCCRSTRWVYIC